MLENRLRKSVAGIAVLPGLARSGRLGLDLGVLEDVRLLLESTLRLNSQFRRHGCGRGR